MQKAIDKGEVVEARREKGVIYYAFRCLVVGTEDGKQEEQTATASKKLTPEEYSTMREVFKGLKWNFELSKKEAIVDSKGCLATSVETLLKQATATSRRRVARRSSS